MSSSASLAIGVRASRMAAGLLLFTSAGLLLFSTTRCYSPTEVTVVISTDLNCGDSLLTGIYKGSPEQFESAPETETGSCTPPPGVASADDSMIGTLVVVPSGKSSNDGRGAIKVILARNHKKPTDCEADITDCIVATRAFSFAEHQSQRLPVRMLKDCLGTPCPFGTTCISAGKCISNECSPGDNNCPLASSDGGGIIDATTRPPKDAGLDGNPSSLLPTCLTGGKVLDNGGTIELAQMPKAPEESLFAASDTTLFYLSQSLQPHQVIGQPKSGAASAVVFKVGQISDAIRAIATDKAGIVVAYQRTATNQQRITSGALDKPLNTSDGTTVPPVQALLTAPDIPNFPPYYAGTSANIWQLEANFNIFVANAGATRVAASLQGTAFYFTEATAAGNLNFALRTKTGLAMPTVMPEAPAKAYFATNKDLLFAAGERQGIGKLVVLDDKGADGPKVTQAVLGSPIPSAFAVDDDSYYFVARSALSPGSLGSNIVQRMDRNNPTGTPLIPVATETGAISNLAVDADPKLGCLYYFVTSPAAGLNGVRLVARPKVLPSTTGK